MNPWEENLRAVRPLLDGAPFPVRGVEANEVLAAVDLDLVTPSGAVRVRLEPNVEGQPAFARSSSLAISHLAGDGDAPLSHAAIHALRTFARHVAARDRGGITLAAPPPPGSRAHAEAERDRDTRDDTRTESSGRAGGSGAHAAGSTAHEAGPSGRRLSVLGDGTSEGSWSRALFDRRIAELAAERGTFLSAILVVVQPCEMSCRFCPSGDRARAVPPDLSAPAHHDDLVHQLAAARALGVDTVEIGGNDVLLFPTAVELFHEAGRLGFRRVSAQSPGQRLADEAFARAVAASPLDRVDLPIYGATAEEHESVTRAPGSFDGLCRAVDRAIALGRPEVRLHTIALRSTLDRLDALLDFAKARFGLDVRVQLLRPNRAGERDHLGDAATLTEIAAAARRRPDHFGDDIPLCALPPERARALHRERTTVTTFGRRLHLWDLGLREGSEDDAVKRDRSIAYPPACDRCALRPGCLGVLRAYLDRFGDAELAPFAGGD